MWSSCNGNASNNSSVDHSETIHHELNILEGDGLLGSEEAQPIQSKPEPPLLKDLMVQCLSCEKWKLIHSMQKYEIIREKEIYAPFVCDDASEWKPYMSCDVPEDETTCDIWAIDVPSIPCPPTGWKREVHFRREGSTRFADVYYYFALSIKKRIIVRSIEDVKKFLNDHPEYIREGVNPSRFSFKMPKPLDENYVKKRTRPAKPTLDAEGDHRESQHGQSSKKTRT
ncbi:unnamed protein product [Arabidopsis arenosa]|uniref:Uncharacterized protein n=1 Tax=Arabidopsis arenosa TaxID=38785 RepID=A0A8S2A2N2_ARAAE|nr:unnamed protein product [Arabidopsis arenosa]